MIDLGLFVACAALVVLVQIAALFWLRRSLERRMAGRLDDIAQALRQQADKETALVRRADDMMDAAGAIIARFDERALAQRQEKIVRLYGTEGG